MLLKRGEAAISLLQALRWRPPSSQRKESTSACSS